MKILTILLLIDLALPFMAYAQEEGHITSGGMDRSFLVYVPPGAGAATGAASGVATSGGK